MSLTASTLAKILATFEVLTTSGYTPLFETHDRPLCFEEEKKNIYAARCCLFVLDQTLTNVQQKKKKTHKLPLTN